jgi:oxygen-independent coproporphyrinogen-3 oxidase
MDSSNDFDAALLRRYDQPGPRYTSYPPAPHFKADFDEHALREAARESNGDPIPRPLSLYVHVPFCTSPCFYCACNRIITRDRGRIGPYLASLYREIDLAAGMFDRDREVVQLHFGGGTPNFLAPEDLAEVVETLRRHFRFADRDRDISIELDPRTLRPGDVAELAAIGFNRASLGVQDFDPMVQAAVNRVQTVEETVSIIDACRRHHMRSVNVDLIYGLPRQTMQGFATTLDQVIAARPDRLAIYGYAHLPKLFVAQRRIATESLPSPDQKLDLLALAIDKLSTAGYVYIGMDHFALPDDELARARADGSLHRNFMGYTTHAQTDLVGFGVSAISHIGTTYSQNARDLPGWQAAISEGRLPVSRGLRLTAEDVLRADLIQALMCQAGVSISALEARHHVDFREHFGDALAALEPMIEDGLVHISSDAIMVTSRGRLLLRNIAMCFDAYLNRPSIPAPTVAPVMFSRAI